MGPNGPRFELIYHNDMIYKCWIDSKFILVHKGILVTLQDCIGYNEQGLWFKSLGSQKSKASNGLHIRVETMEIWLIEAKLHKVHGNTVMSTLRQNQGYL